MNKARQASPRGKFGDGVRAVDRALDVLAAFSAQAPSMSAVELARRVKLSRPTLYRLLYTLERKGFITSRGDPQRFTLGPAIGQLGNAWLSALDIGTLAQAALKGIWEATGETVSLFVQRGDQRLCIAEIVSPQPLSFRRGVGYSDIITSGASGRAILAFSDQATIDRLVARAGNTLEPDALRAELARIRERGYAWSHNEFIRGAVAVAAPFRDLNGQIVGCITVFGPEARLDMRKVDDFGRLLVERTAALCGEMGYRAAATAPAAVLQEAPRASAAVPTTRPPAAKPVTRRKRKATRRAA